MNVTLQPSSQTGRQGTDMSTDDSSRLQRIIVEYAAAIDSGESLDPQHLLRAHPELADHLKALFGESESSADAIPEPTMLQHAPAADTSPAGASGVLNRGTSGGFDEPTLPLDQGTPKDSTDSKESVIRRFGDYELLSEIARGGMGVVYKARQISLNRIVAVKMVLAGQLAGDADVQRFRVEAEAAANLNHSGIVSVFEVGCHEGQHYFSMGFVEGQSLADRIAEGPLPVDEAVELTRQVAEAVQHAHQQNVIHRDLKPANVLLDQAGNAHVTDFGLAKRLRVDSELTGTGQILGTPSYMPPEQTSGAQTEIDVTLDVYSLGAILYSLLTGRPPFQAASPVETLLQVQERDPVPPRQLNRDVPRDLEVICLKCLRKEPSKRYATAQELAEDLDRWRTGRPISARPASVSERAIKWARRRPVVTGLIALLLLVSTIGFAGIAWQWREAEEARLAELTNRKKIEQLTTELLELYSQLDQDQTTDSATEELQGPEPLTADRKFSLQQSEPTADSEQPPPSPAARAKAHPLVGDQFKPGIRSPLARRGRPAEKKRSQRRRILESKLNEKIGELRKVSPELADRYQRLAPP